MVSRLTWREICRSNAFRGRWVALDHCRYDQTTATPAEGEVVDSDEDLAELCRRMRETDRSHCAILFCEDEAIVDSQPLSVRATWRAMQH